MKFTAEDFVLENESLNPGLSVGHILAEKANAKLQEWLNAAPTVYGQSHSKLIWISDKLETQGTHKAKLVCIEEIK